MNAVTGDFNALDFWYFGSFRNCNKTLDRGRKVTKYIHYIYVYVFINMLYVDTRLKAASRLLFPSFVLHSVYKLWKSTQTHTQRHIITGRCQFIAVDTKKYSYKVLSQKKSDSITKALP